MHMRTAYHSTYWRSTISNPRIWNRRTALVSKETRCSEPKSWTKVPRNIYSWDKTRPHIPTFFFLLHVNVWESMAAPFQSPLSQNLSLWLPMAHLYSLLQELTWLRWADSLPRAVHRHFQHSFHPLSQATEKGSQINTFGRLIWERPQMKED